MTFLHIAPCYSDGFASDFHRIPFIPRGTHTDTDIKFVITISHFLSDVNDIPKIPMQRNLHPETLPQARREAVALAISKRYNRWQFFRILHFAIRVLL